MGTQTKHSAKHLAYDSKNMMPSPFGRGLVVKPDIIKNRISQGEKLLAEPSGPQRKQLITWFHIPNSGMAADYMHVAIRFGSKSKFPIDQIVRLGWNTIRNLSSPGTLLEVEMQEIITHLMLHWIEHFDEHKSTAFSCLNALYPSPTNVCAALEKENWLFVKATYGHLALEKNLPNPFPELEGYQEKSKSLRFYVPEEPSFGPLETDIPVEELQSVPIQEQIIFTEKTQQASHVEELSSPAPVENTVGLKPQTEQEFLQSLQRLFQKATGYVQKGSELSPVMAHLFDIHATRYEELLEQHTAAFSSSARQVVESVTDEVIGRKIDHFLLNVKNSIEQYYSDQVKEIQALHLALRHSEEDLNNAQSHVQELEAQMQDIKQQVEDLYISSALVTETSAKIALLTNTKNV